MTLKGALNHFLLISLLLFQGCSTTQITEIEEDFSFDEDAADASLSFLFGELSIYEKKPLEAIEHYEDLIDADTNYPVFVGERLLRLYVFTKDFDNASYLIEQLLERDLDLKTKLDLLRVRSSIELSQKDNKAAQVSLEEIIALSPKPLPAEYLSLTSLLLRAGEVQRAETLLTEFSSSYPQDIQAKLLLSNLYIKGKRHRDAELLLMSVKKDSIPKGLLLTRALLGQNKVNEANETLEVLAESYPDSPEIKKIQSAIKLKENSTEEALALLKSASQLEADSFNTRLRIALVKLENQRFLEAETDLLLLAEEKPEHARVNYFLALAQINAGKSNAALESLEKISKENKSLYRTAKTLRADLFRREQNFSAGSAELADLVDDYPDDIQLLALHAYFQRNSQDILGASKTFKKIATLSPTVDNYYSLATLQDELGLPNEAIKYGNKALLIDPKHANTANFVAYLLALKGAELERAKSLIEIALKKEPKNGYFLDTLAWVHFAQKDYKNAAVVIKEALEYTPHDGTILKHYGQILEKLGKLKSAKVAYQKAKNYSKNDEELLFINKRLEELGK